MINSTRRLFRILNKYFMVPVFRCGFGPFMGNPISGYIMILKTIGRKTGLVRYAPVNYALIGGNIYCLSGFGRIAHWYKNLSANPQIDVILSTGTLSGKAETVSDEAENKADAAYGNVLITNLSVIITDNIPTYVFSMEIPQTFDGKFLYKAIKSKISFVFSKMERDLL